MANVVSATNVGSMTVRAPYFLAWSKMCIAVSSTSRIIPVLEAVIKTAKTDAHIAEIDSADLPRQVIREHANENVKQANTELWFGPESTPMLRPRSTAYAMSTNTNIGDISMLMVTAARSTSKPCNIRSNPIRGAMSAKPVAVAKTINMPINLYR